MSSLADAITRVGFLRREDFVPADTDPSQGTHATREIGPYLLIERIWSRNQVEVHVALDRALDREVAVKLILAPGLEEQARLRRSSRLWADLEDVPHVVPVYAAGPVERDYFVAMRYLRGGSLEHRVLAPEVAADVIAKMARAVHVGHRRGLIHRDIKPANILMDEDGVPHLADFGLAKPTVGTRATEVSATGLVLGTPGYMAPEQALGEPLSPAADVYGLGATLFALLTGRAPITGASVYEVIKTLLECPPPSLRALDPSLPAGLDAIVSRAMAHDPDDRPFSAAELAEDLEAFLRGDPPVDPRAQRPRGWRGVGVVALVLLVAALAVAYAWRVESPPADPLPATARLDRPLPTPVAEPTPQADAREPNRTAAPDTASQTRAHWQAGRGAEALVLAQAAGDPELAERARLLAALQATLSWQTGALLLRPTGQTQHTDAFTRRIQDLGRARGSARAPVSPTLRRWRAAHEAALGHVSQVLKGQAPALHPEAVTSLLAREETPEAHLLVAAVAFVRAVRGTRTSGFGESDVRRELDLCVQHARSARPLRGADYLLGQALLRRVRPNAFPDLRSLRATLDSAIGAFSRVIEAPTAPAIRRVHARVLRARALSLRAVSANSAVLDPRSGRLKESTWQAPATTWDDLGQAERDLRAAFVAEPNLAGFDRWVRLMLALRCTSAVLEELTAGGHTDLAARVRKQLGRR